jgi:hypothetical protein
MPSACLLFSVMLHQFRFFDPPVAEPHFDTRSSDVVSAFREFLHRILKAFGRHTSMRQMFVLIRRAELLTTFIPTCWQAGHVTPQ